MYLELFPIFILYLCLVVFCFFKSFDFCLTLIKFLLTICLKLQYNQNICLIFVCLVRTGSIGQIFWIWKQRCVEQRNKEIKLILFYKFYKHTSSRCTVYVIRYTYTHNTGDNQREFNVNLINKCKWAKIYYDTGFSSSTCKGCIFYIKIYYHLKIIHVYI